jgi:hypothetical protein
MVWYLASEYAIRKATNEEVFGIEWVLCLDMTASQINCVAEKFVSQRFAFPFLPLLKMRDFIIKLRGICKINGFILCTLL